MDTKRRAVVSSVGGEFTTCLVEVEQCQIKMKLRAFYKLWTTNLNSSIDEYFPEHGELFHMVHQRLFKYICSDSLVFSFALSPQLDMEATHNCLRATIDGLEGHPQPFLHFDEVKLMNLVLDWESLVEAWLSNPRFATE